jgi:hypothetical protein
VNKGRVRGARAVIVLLTDAGAKSRWVTYEIGLASGANVRVIPVAMPGIAVPDQMKHLQVITYASPEEALKRIHSSIEGQGRTSSGGPTSPTMLAKFMEYGGRPVRIKAQPPALRIEVWFDQVPARTQKVKFEIPDREIEDREWYVFREMEAGEEMRQFLSTGIVLNRNVDIWALGTGPDMDNWSAKSTIHEALNRYYAERPINADIRDALSQFDGPGRRPQAKQGY